MANVKLVISTDFLEFEKKLRVAKAAIKNLHKPWYHRWNNGNNPVLWAIRTTLLKLDNMGLIHLKIGQRYKFKDILP